MGRRILVVEDNEANSELLRDWLEALGYEVVCTRDLAEAQGALNTELPAAILLDVQLGQEDGLSLAAAVRGNSRTARLPVIAVTAHAMLTDHERVLRAGCDACISKPIDFKSLRAHLERFLAERNDSAQ
jgi:two-component system cell cycle response regulator DivK